VLCCKYRADAAQSTNNQVGFLTAAKLNSGMCQARRALLRPMAGINCATRSQRLLFKGLLGAWWLFFPIAFWHSDKPGVIALDYLLFFLSIFCSPGNRPILWTVGDHGNFRLSLVDSISHPFSLFIKRADSVIQCFLPVRMRC
jgi:hypothetical protein